MNRPGSDPGVGGTPASPGNAYYGSNAAQGGTGNSQYNYYTQPRSKAWMAVAAAAALALTGGSVLAWHLVPDTPGGERQGARQNPVVSPDAASDPTSPAGAPAPAESPSTGSPEPKRPAGPSGSTRSSGSDAVQWQGSVRLTNKGLILDAVPPQLDEYDYDLYPALFQPPVLAAGDSVTNTSNLAAWPGPGVPSRHECLELVSTQGIEMVEAKKGAVVCVRTQGGRIARLTVESVSRDPFSGVLVRATVWSEVWEGAAG